MSSEQSKPSWIPDHPGFDRKPTLGLDPLLIIVSVAVFIWAVGAALAAFDVAVCVDSSAKPHLIPEARLEEPTPAEPQWGQQQSLTPDVKRKKEWSVLVAPVSIEPIEIDPTDKEVVRINKLLRRLSKRTGLTIPEILYRSSEWCDLDLERE